MTHAFIEHCKQVAREHQAACFHYKLPEHKVRKRILVDAFTAQMVVQVWPKLNEAMQAKVAHLVDTKGPLALENVFWKTIKS